MRMRTVLFCALLGLGYGSDFVNIGNSNCLPEGYACICNCFGFMIADVMTDLAFITLSLMIMIYTIYKIKYFFRSMLRKETNESSIQGSHPSGYERPQVESNIYATIEGV